jgi:hypothetical protein
MISGPPAVDVELPVAAEFPEAALPTCEESGSLPQPGTAASKTGRARQLTSSAEGSLRLRGIGSFDGIDSRIGSRVSKKFRFGS